MQNIMLLDKGHVLIAGIPEDFQDPVTCKAARLTGCKNISKLSVLANTGSVPLTGTIWSSSLTVRLEMI